MIVDKKNVICIKWGYLYSSEDVNILYKSLINNTSYDINFYCFTDNPENLDKNITTYPIPKLKNIDKVDCCIYQKEVGLCDNNLGNLNGQRALFLDLDTVIVGNIDCFFELPKNDEFFIIKDWNNNSNNVGQASCYSWVIGTLGFIKDDFEKDYARIYKKYNTASQEYLSKKVIDKYGKLNFWPKEWCKSFKVHCLPNPFVPFSRRFIKAKIPMGAKIICFHGQPKPKFAKEGIWPEKNLIKKFLYKHLRPVDWLNNY